MPQLIITSFSRIHEIQKKLMSLCDQRMELLLSHAFKDAEQLHKQEMFLLHDLEKELKELSEAIRMVSVKHQLPTAQLTPLLSYLSVEAQTKIMEAQQSAFHYEQELTNKLKNAERLVQTKMVVPEIIRQTIIAHQKENGSEGSGIIDRKY